MLAFRLTDGTGNTPEWFIHLVRQRPALVAEVLSLYAGTTLKAGKDFVDSIYPLEHNTEYREVAILTKAGFQDVANLAGGMLRWRVDGGAVSGGQV